MLDTRSFDSSEMDLFWTHVQLSAKLSHVTDTNGQFSYLASEEMR